MNFQDRIQESAVGVQFIELTPAEKAIYPGADWHLVAIEDGQIVEVLDVTDGLSSEEMDACFEQHVDMSLQGKRLLEWSKNKEVWLGMFSCYEFCEPQPFDENVLARVSRLIVKMIRGE